LWSMAMTLACTSQPPFQPLDMTGIKLKESRSRHN
jgi:hypothetical protein